MGQLLQRPSSGSSGGISPIAGIFRQVAGLNGFPTVPTAFTFDTVVVDNGGWHVAGPPFSSITVPVTGLYQVNGCIAWPGFAAFVAVNFGINGVIGNTGGGSSTTNNVANGVSTALSALLSLVAGQTLQLFGVQTSGGTPNGLIGNLSIFRVS